MPSAIPPVGWARVWSVDPPLEVAARLSDERPDVAQGFGGWDEVARPRRSPLTTWTGAPGLHLTLPLLFDHFATQTSVEGDLAQLVRMGQPTAADGEPPRLHIAARGSAVPFQGRTWVLNGLTWGDAEMNAAGNRVRQQVSLDLIEFVEDVHLTLLSSANQARAKAAAAKKKRGAAKKRVTAKKSAKARRATRTGTEEWGQGEDLLTIAANELGDANRWPEIAALNGLRDPRAITPGQVIRLP